MTEMARTNETADRHARWVAMWREGVRASNLALALGDLSTTSFVEMSEMAAKLLGTTPEGGAGLNYLAVVERPREAAQTFRLARDGLIDGIRGRRRFRRQDGSPVEVETWGWVIRSRGGPQLGLWLACEVSTQTGHSEFVDDVLVSPSRRARSEFEGTWVALDEHWRVVLVKAKSAPLLGGAPTALLGNSIIELTHPDDVAALLFAFARATTMASARVRVRLRNGDGSWQRIHVAPTVLEGGGHPPSRSC